ncbi:MAG: hypothetical protein CL489_06900 [Acidobacteria bacterium]|nr:hypothetical protein [Acidobacteriota bacterium]|tara:strand:+ start:87 stop:449 length:363 start_codon:yes stop_codon:yes gene_type:complete
MHVHSVYTGKDKDDVYIRLSVGRYGRIASKHDVRIPTDEAVAIIGSWGDGVTSRTPWGGKSDEHECFELNPKGQSYYISQWGDDREEITREVAADIIRVIEAALRGERRPRGFDEVREGE